MAKLEVGVNDLATVCPEIAAEWDYEKKSTTPTKGVVLFKSGMSFGKGYTLFYFMNRLPTTDELIMLLTLLSCCIVADLGKAGKLKHWRVEEAIKNG